MSETPSRSVCSPKSVPRAPRVYSQVPVYRQVRAASSSAFQYCQITVGGISTCTDGGTAVGCLDEITRAVDAV